MVICNLSNIDANQNCKIRIPRIPSAILIGFQGNIAETFGLIIRI